jgi:hypothetical protein
MANPGKIARKVAGIVGKGGKNVKPVYNELERKAKRQAAAFAAGFAATAGGLGYEYKKTTDEARKNISAVEARLAKSKKKSRGD